MRVVCISDTHTLHNKVILPKGDMIICAGDISSRGYKIEIQQFLDWYSQTDYKYKILIAGNHDFWFDTNSTKTTQGDIEELLSQYSTITYLNDSGIEIEGLKLWGSPVQPWFFNWAFNRQRGEDIKKHWNLIPKDTEILITHGPPFNHGDKLLHNGEKVGCKDLSETIKTLLNLKTHIFGHIHEGYGVTQENNIQYINTSCCTVNYHCINKPIVFDIDLVTKQINIVE